MAQLVVCKPQFNQDRSLVGWVVTRGRGKTKDAKVCKSQRQASLVVGATIRGLAAQRIPVEFKSYDSDGKLHFHQSYNADGVRTDHPIAAPKPRKARKPKSAKPVSAKKPSAKPVSAKKSARKGKLNPGLARFQAAVRAYKEAHPGVSHKAAVNAVKGAKPAAAKKTRKPRKAKSAAPRKAARKGGGRRKAVAKTAGSAIPMPSAGSIAKPASKKARKPRKAKSTRAKKPKTPRTKKAPGTPRTKVAKTGKRKGGKRKVNPGFAAWQKHLAAFRAENPGLSLKDAMKGAKKTWKK